MNAETYPPEQALPARAPMFPSTPLHDAAAPAVWTRPPTAMQRLLAFFDAGLFRLVGYAALTPLLLRSLGEVQFGMMAFTFALLGLLAWLPRAVQAESARLLAASAKVGDESRVQALLDATALALLGLGVLVGGSLALSRHAIAALLDLDGISAQVFTTWLLLEAIRFAVTSGLAVWQAAVDGFGHDAARASVRGSQALMEALLCLAVVTLGLGLPGLAGLGIVAAVAVAALAWRTAQTLRPAQRRPRHQHARPWRADPRLAAELLATSAVAGGQHATFLLAVETGVLIIAAVQGVQAVVLYAIAVHGVRLLAGAGLQIAGGLYPPFASLALHAERLHARWVFRRGTDAALIAVSGLALAIIPFGAGLLELWLGMRNVSKPMVALLGALLLTSAPLAVAARYVSRAGLTTRLALVLLVEVTVATLLGLALVGGQGLIGVAAAALVAQALAALLLVRVACRHMGIAPWRFWLGRAWRISLVLAPPLAAVLLFVLVKSVRNMRDLVLQGGIVLILHAVAAFTAWYLLETRPEQDVD